MTIRAAIDCGTNTVRLLIVDDDGIVLGRDSHTTRLGYQLSETGRLNSDSIDKTLFAFSSFKDQMEAYDVEQFRAVATSASRDAINSQELLGNAGAVLGQPLEVITGKQEAELSYSGAIHGRPEGNYFLVDVGGGSTEFVNGTELTIDQSVSINLGCVRTSEQLFAGEGPFSEDQVRRAVRTIEQSVRPAGDKVQVSPDSHFVGVAGTVTTIAAALYEIDRYEPGIVHGKVISKSALDGLFARFTELTVDGIRAMPGIPTDRAEVITAGAAIVQAFMATFSVPFLTVSESDILDGIIASI